MITLPTDPLIPDEFRICYSDGWKSGADWTAINAGVSDGGMASGLGPGLRVVRYTRCALPEFGECELEAPLGLIDGSECMVSIGDSGSEWVPGSSYINTPDLLKKVIRVQSRPGVHLTLRANGSPHPVNDNDRPWKTVWLGVCLWQRDEIPPGAQRIIGHRRWYCVDLLYAYLRGYHIDRHAFAPTSGTVHSPCEGHPSFNENGNSDRPISGNKSSVDTWTPTAPEASAPTVKAFSIPGTRYSETWNDLEVAEYACLVARRPGDPIVSISGDTAPLDIANFWPVTPTTTAWDIVTSIFRRQRGRGLGVFEWSEETPSDNAPTAISEVTIRVYPQFKSTIQVSTDGVDTLFPGADSTSGGRTITARPLDLIGDHRNVDEVFDIDQRDEARVDYLETVGEPIEVVVTVGYVDETIEAGWTTSEASSYDSADVDKRSGPRWDHVYQVHALTTVSGKICKAADGNGGIGSSFIYTVDAGDGTISSGESTTGSLTSISILPDLPFLVGKNYAYDPPTDYGDIPRNPGRRPPLVLIRDMPDRYEDHSKNVRMDLIQHGFRIEWSGSVVPLDGGGVESYRPVSKLSAENNAAFADTSQIVTTIALQLHTRLRAASGDNNSSRRKRIYIQGLHLWLAHPGTIHDLDTDSADGNGIPARRITTLTKLRDDRSTLRKLHALAWAWYGSEHRACRWGLRAHGMNLLSNGEIGFYNLASGSRVGVAYPMLGQVITTLSAGGLTDGEAITLNTPVTRIEYDNDQGITIWHTDWSELDLGAFNARHG